MDSLIVLASIPAIVSAIAFLALTPRNAKESQIKTFNVAWLAFVFFLLGGWWVHMRYNFDPRFEDYRPTLGWLGAFAIVTLALVFGLLVRNFWIFRQSKLPGQPSA